MVDNPMMNHKNNRKLLYAEKVVSDIQKSDPFFLLNAVDIGQTHTFSLLLLFRIERMHIGFED